MKKKISLLFVMLFIVATINACIPVITQPSCFTPGIPLTVYTTLESPGDWDTNVTYGWEEFYNNSWHNLNTNNNLYVITSMPGQSRKFRMWAKEESCCLNAQQGHKYYSVPVTVMKCCQLPLSLISFTGINKGDGIQLNWKTVSEINTDHFNVERSIDGINFTSISVITATGATSQERDYQSSDMTTRTLNTPYAYYRLKMVDTNGSYAYSIIIKIATNSKGIDISIGPNPFQSILHIYATGIDLSTATIKLVNIQGQCVINQKIGYSDIDVSRLLSGVYSYQIAQNNVGIIQSGKLMKQ